MDKMSLAIVDDEEEILSALKRLLRGQYEVSIFASAQDCLRAFECDHFDLVLSDIRMPVMDGFALMERVREISPDTARLCISGYADMQDCHTAIEQGLFEFIVAKPWDNFELKQVLKVFAENVRLKASLTAALKTSSTAPATQRTHDSD